MPSRPATNSANPAKTKKRGPRMYDTRRWRRLRDEYASANPMCEECERNGKIKLGQDVDHIKPHRNDPNLMWDWNNLQHLCGPCHKAKTKAENAKPHRAAILPGFVQVSAKPLLLVCGPPCGGKSIYVEKHATNADLVLDLDLIAQELHGKPLIECTEQERFDAIRERNSLLANYCAGRTEHERCYLIATAGSYKHRKFWADKGAEIIQRHPGIDECLMRLEARTWLSEGDRTKLASVIRSWA